MHTKPPLREQSEDYFIMIKSPVKAENNLMKGGWVEKEKGLWFHDITPSLGEIYPIVKKVYEELKNEIITKETFERIEKIREEGNSCGKKYPVC